MILLKATPESLQITTTTTAAIDYSISYADITTSTFLPSTSEGAITTATTTSVLAAPAASTQRQVKLVSISNRGGTSNTVVVKKLITATTYNLTPTFTLLAGETVQYMDGQGWIYYSATGAVKTPQNVAGSDTQIQYNNAGVLTGDANLTWASSTNTLTVAGTNAQVQLGAVTAVPAAPSAGILELYAQRVSGKVQLMKQGPSADDEAVQASLWQNNTVIWTPGASGSPGGTFQGTVGTGTSGSVVLPTTTNVYTSMRRMTYANTTTANQQIGFRTENMFFRGAATGMGGFFFVCRFGFTAWAAGSRLFIGMSAATTALTTVDPTTVAHTIGFAVNAGGTAISFIHSDATTPATSDAISGQPALAANNAYDAYIYCKPNDTTVYYRLEDATTGAVIVDSSTTTTLPLNTTLLAAHCAVSGGASVTAATVSLGVNRLYVETNR